MPATPYKNVTFTTGADLDDNIFNQMANNEQWLFENMPKMAYRATGINRASGLKILTGLTPYQPTTQSWVNVDVSFGTYFTPGVQPVVVATNVSRYSHRKFVSLRALDQTDFIDHRGFTGCITTYEWLFDGGIRKTIEVPGYMNWIAIGW